MALFATFLVVRTDKTAVPEHLLGVWGTSEPKFAHCKIEFLQGHLILGLANGRDTYCRIDKITSVQESGQRVMYTIHYRDEGGSGSTLCFRYDPHSGGTLQLKNHSEIWERSR